MSISCQLARQFVEHDWPPERMTEEFVAALGELLTHIEGCAACSSELKDKFEDLLVRPGVTEAFDYAEEQMDKWLELTFGPDWKQTFRDLESNNK